uniref:Uncharacterized protein n=1 Tax=Arundo donax TaxID=35708 RepID=A0A0A9E9G4_ARUDO
MYQACKSCSIHTRLLFCKRGIFRCWGHA